MSETTSRVRDYTGLLSACRRLTGDRATRMAGLVDIAWDALASEDVSWLGFYLPDQMCIRDRVYDLMQSENIPMRTACYAHALNRLAEAME